MATQQTITFLKALNVSQRKCIDMLSVRILTPSSYILGALLIATEMAQLHLAR